MNKGSPGFGYGFVCAFCFTLAFFCLLCGLVLDGFKDVVKLQLEVKCASISTTAIGDCDKFECRSGPSRAANSSKLQPAFGDHNYLAAAIHV